MSMKKQGFTLGEVVTTLAIVGVIVALTLPLLLGDIASKHRMVTLRNTIGNLNYAVQTFMQKHRINDMIDFAATNGEIDFRNYLSIKNEVADSCIERTASGGCQPHNVMGDSSSNLLPLNAGFGNIYILENNVLIAQRSFTIDGNKVFQIFIDVNGKDKPNTIGIDAFIAHMYKSNVRDDDGNIIIRAGDITGYLPGKKTDADLKTLCESGDGIACYTLAEKNDFDPDYINK